MSNNQHFNESYFERCPHDRENPYVMISKAMLADTSISPKAKGVLCYLLSLPPGWRIFHSHLKKSLAVGEDYINTAIEELINAGYVDRSRERLNGTFQAYKYKVREFKKFPPNGENRPGFSGPGNPVIVNTERKEELYKEQQQGAAAPPPPAVVVSPKSEENKQQSANEKSKSQSGVPAPKPDDPLPIKMPQQLIDADITLEWKKTLIGNYKDNLQYLINAIEWATDARNPVRTTLIQSIRNALKYGLSRKDLDKPQKPSAPVDYAPFNKANFREINTHAHKNGHRLNSYGLREMTDYLETENDRIYFRDYSFLEQLSSFLRKQDIHCPSLYAMIKQCQENLAKER